MKEKFTLMLVLLSVSLTNAQQSSLKLAKQDYMGTTEIKWDSSEKLNLLSLNQVLFKADFNKDSLSDAIGYKNMGQSIGQLILFFSLNKEPQELLSFSYNDIYDDNSTSEGVWLYSKDIFGDTNKELFLLFNSNNESWVQIISYSNGKFFTDKYILNPNPVQQQYLLVDKKKLLIPEGSHSMTEEEILVH